MSQKIDEPVLLDTEFLGKYTLGNAELESEVLHMFIDQSALYLERLRSPQSSKDWFEAAHSLKGSARGIGAFVVGMRAAQLEQAEEPLNESIRTAILSLLETDLEKTRVAILRHLDISSQATLS